MEPIDPMEGMLDDEDLRKPVQTAKCPYCSRQFVQRQEPPAPELVAMSQGQIGGPYWFPTFCMGPDCMATDEVVGEATRSYRMKTEDEEWLLGRMARRSGRWLEFLSEPRRIPEVIAEAQRATITEVALEWVRRMRPEVLLDDYK